MNAHDLALWTKGLEKLQAGELARLTDDEREVLTFYGGKGILAPRPAPRARAIVRRSAPQLQRAWLTPDRLTFS